MTTSQLTEHRNTAQYHRPEWMTEEQFKQVSADMTDRWLELLDRAAHDAAQQPQS